MQRALGALVVVESTCRVQEAWELREESKFGKMTRYDIEDIQVRRRLKRNETRIKVCSRLFGIKRCTTCGGNIVLKPLYLHLLLVQAELSALARASGKKKSFSAP